ncbi:MAG: glutathione peroxidase [Gammaproteobacteria bacterium]|nr:glutathione peroxidase [Gammaproteobacteria bacterium]
MKPRDAKFLLMPVTVSLVLLFLLFRPAMAGSQGPQVCADNQDFNVRRLDSEQTENICQAYRGKVLLVVNTASRCGFTDQYADLEQLYAQYRDQGLEIAGFPSNDFGNQEPGSEGSIKSFCRLTYGVRFPMYAKTRVRGQDADPFYKALAQAAGTEPRWNFHKYLLDRDGKLVGSFGSSTNPQGRKIIEAIESVL